ncbi:DnaJsubfamily C member 10 [Sesamum alatum]|uniref:DnaJsubfamily C member 10 n=1 Tax=Sesamum alatum TaxID=300844 RepID=A0AAE1Y5C0_9LAMI|nr:DnaJsubfamily C member 10 [Sesamum alatum]
MEAEVDHYAVLGLPSGEEGARLSEQEISKAYRSKARELHPDKRPDDPNAHANFLKLQTSYEVLRDEKARKLFDDLLRVKREKLHRQGQQDSKRRKMMSDLEERERSAFAVDPNMKAREEEERISRKLKEEIARIRAMQANKTPAATTPFKQDTKARGKDSMDSGGGNGLDKEKVLKISWEKIGEDYTAHRLREIFEKFGAVEDVVIKSSKKKGSALVVMASKDAAVAATGNVLGDLSNPLLVLPLQPATSPVIFSAEKNDSDGPKLSNLVGAGYKAFEDSVLDKLKKAAQRQKLGFHFFHIFQWCQSAYATAPMPFQSKSYTSLKDLLPDSPPWTASPTASWKDSWREIPIKDPLLQHAAWAYLQPVGAELEEHHHWWSRLTESCCGCFYGVVLMVFGCWFSEQGSETLAVLDNGKEID